MSLSARLDSPLSLFRKLERESYRAFHAETPLHKADHFFNFCVTAASMRDYMLEHLGKTSKADKQPYYDAWSKVAVLVAAAEIANSSKHFVLRDKTGLPTATKTRSVSMKKAPFINVYRNDVGEMRVAKVQRTEVVITLSDGRVAELYAFTADVLAYWKKFLSSEGFVVRRQSFSRLAGR